MSSRFASMIDDDTSLNIKAILIYIGFVTNARHHVGVWIIQYDTLIQKWVSIEIRNSNFTQYATVSKCLKWRNYILTAILSKQLVPTYRRNFSTLSCSRSFHLSTTQESVQERNKIERTQNDLPHLIDDILCKWQISYFMTIADIWQMETCLT